LTSKTNLKISAFSFRTSTIFAVITGAWGGLVVNLLAPKFYI